MKVKEYLSVTNTNQTDNTSLNFHWIDDSVVPNKHYYYDVSGKYVWSDNLKTNVPDEILASKIILVTVEYNSLNFWIKQPREKNVLVDKGGKKEKEVDVQEGGQLQLSIL